MLRYHGNYRAKSFSTFDQFLCLAYAQMAGRESLRDIETCLNSHRDKLYHISFRGAVSRSTLADANERRDWRIFQDFGLILIRTAQKLYQDEPFALELEQPLYAFDSTQPSTCACLCSPGLNFAPQRPLSKCIPCLIYEEPFRPM